MNRSTEFPARCTDHGAQLVPLTDQTGRDERPHLGSRRYQLPCRLEARDDARLHRRVVVEAFAARIVDRDEDPRQPSQSRIDVTTHAGIALVEVLIAIFITGIGLLALLALFQLGAIEMAEAIRI